jgi:hypothetical protein
LTNPLLAFELFKIENRKEMKMKKKSAVTVKLNKTKLAFNARASQASGIL